MKFLILGVLFSILMFQAARPQEAPPPFNIGNVQSDTAVIAEMSQGPTVEIITISDKQPKELIRIKDAQGKELIVVNMDGSVTTSNGFKADDAAKDFWSALARAYPRVCDALPSEAKPRN